MRQLLLAARSLRRAPSFASAAALTLALGIGLATAVFTVAHTLLVRDLPVREQDRLVVLWGRMPDGSFDHYPLSFTAAREFAGQSGSLEVAALVATEGAWPTPIMEGDRLTRLRRALVSGNFFDVLGARALLGRTLEPSDDIVGAARVLVLSYRAWQQHFGGDPQVVGQRVVLHETGEPHSIVGVMPPGLEYPSQTDLWAALVPARTRSGADSTFAQLDVLGRLAPGATAEEARRDLGAFFGRPETSPWQRQLQAVVHNLPRLVLGETKPALIAFSVAAALLLLIACVNVATLLVVRGLARRREVAVRTALGASRRQVMVHLLSESAVLALIGGALGALVATGAVRTFVAIAPPGTPRLDELGVSGAILAGGVVITGIALLVFALAPAMLTSRVAPQQVLRSDTRQSASRRSRLAAEGLVAVQVALALVVLSSAGLVVTTLVKLQQAELSLASSRLLVAELALRYDIVDDLDAQLALVDRLVPRIAALPEVARVSPVVAAPFSGSGGWDSRPAAEGQTPEEAAVNPMLNMDVVGPDYFATMGMPILQGRSFTPQDREGQPSVVVLSEAAARYYWPGEDPIGKRLSMGARMENRFTVVGIVPETRYRDLRVARPSIYFPLQQSIFPFAPTAMAIRTLVSPERAIPTIRRAIRETSPGVELESAAPFDAYLDAPLAQPRLNAILLAMFAGAAVVLAGIGLFGVMATMIRQRSRELGVRMALGATVANVRSMVLARGLCIALVGAVVGLAGALATNRLLSTLLYDVSPTDALTLAAVTGLLLGIAVIASLLPARALGRIDPVTVLRADG